MINPSLKILFIEYIKNNESYTLLIELGEGAKFHTFANYNLIIKSSISKRKDN